MVCNGFVVETITISVVVSIVFFSREKVSCFLKMANIIFLLGMSHFAQKSVEIRGVRFTCTAILKF